MSGPFVMDPAAVLAPLLAASPGSSFVSCCGLCGQRIEGLTYHAGDNSGCRHFPGECPPPPSRPAPQCPHCGWAPCQGCMPW